MVIHHAKAGLNFFSFHTIFFRVQSVFNPHSGQNLCFEKPFHIVCIHGFSGQGFDLALQDVFSAWIVSRHDGNGMTNNLFHGFIFYVRTFFRNKCSDTDFSQIEIHHASGVKRKTVGHPSGFRRKDHLIPQSLKLPHKGQGGTEMKSRGHGSGCACTPGNHLDKPYQKQYPCILFSFFHTSLSVSVLCPENAHPGSGSWFNREEGDTGAATRLLVQCMNEQTCCPFRFFVIHA